MNPYNAAVSFLFTFPLGMKVIPPGVCTEILLTLGEPTYPMFPCSQGKELTTSILRIHRILDLLSGVYRVAQIRNIKPIPIL